MNAQGELVVPWAVVGNDNCTLSKDLLYLDGQNEASKLSNHQIYLWCPTQFLLQQDWCSELPF